MAALTTSARRLRLNVTQWHINHGRRGSCSSCPIALAAKDSPDFPGNPDDYDIGVGGRELIILDRTSPYERVWRGELDAACVAFIGNFDQYVRPYEPKPFSTEVTLTLY